MLLWSSIMCWNKYLLRPTTDVCCSMIACVASMRSSTVGIVCFWFLFTLWGLGTSTSSFTKSFDILLKGMRLQTMQRMTQRRERPKEWHRYTDSGRERENEWQENNTENDTDTQYNTMTDILLTINNVDVILINHLSLCMSSLCLLANGQKCIQVQSRLSKMAS